MTDPMAHTLASDSHSACHMLCRQRSFAALVHSLSSILPLCLAVWLATCVGIPLVGNDPWGLTLHELLGWAVLLGVLAPKWKVLSRSSAFWFGAILVLWFASRTPMADFGRLRTLALAVTVCLAVRFSAESWKKELPNAFLWLNLLVLGLSFLDGLFHSANPLFRHWCPVPVFWTNLLRWSGFFTHPNLFAFFVVFSLWVGLAARWPRGKTGWGLALLQGVLTGWCMIETYSRTGVILLLLACVAWGWHVRKARSHGEPQGAHWILVGTVLGSLLLIFACRWSDIAPRFSEAKNDFDVSAWNAASQGASPQAVTTGADALTLAPEALVVPNSRYAIFRDAWNIWLERPWTGWGAGGYGRQGHSGHHHAHNLILEAGVCGGIIGLALLLFPLGLALLRGRDFFARGFIALALVSALMDCYFVYRWPAVILALCVGLAGRHE